MSVGVFYSGPHRQSVFKYIYVARYPRKYCLLCIIYLWSVYFSLVKHLLNDTKQISTSEFFQRRRILNKVNLLKFKSEDKLKLYKICNKSSSAVKHLNKKQFYVYNSYSLILFIMIYD